MEKKTFPVVVNGVTTQKKYVKPECEVIDLDVEPMLLSVSNYGARFQDVDRDEEEW
jgi:hypothetical protein